MDDPPQGCAPSELQRKRQAKDDFLLLDVRSQEEFDIAAIKPALLIPLDELPEHLDDLNAWRDREIICICHLGIRSAHAQQFLRDQGFKNVRNLLGGIHAYALDVDESVPLYH